MEFVLLILALVALVYLFSKKTPSKQRPDEQRARATPAGTPHEKINTFQSGTSELLSGVETLLGYAHVVDGDTIIVRKTQIRLFGIDAPEINHPYGIKSKWAMVELCKGNKIRAELQEADAHGRTVAKCYLPDGRDLSAELVKQGLAIDWPKYSDGVYRHLETPNARKKMWLADARQKGRMHLWDRYERQQSKKQASKFCK